MSNQPHIDREFAFTDDDFNFLAKLANRKTGIVLPEKKRDMIYSRLARRLRALGLANFSEYCALLQDDAAEELTQMINAVTTNLTSFFREPHHFDHLRADVLQPLMQNKQRRIRLWSAACSSGMEPYSMAMVVKQTFPDIAQWDAKILATDIDSTMIAHSIRGEYSATDMRSIPANYRHYFKREEQGRMQIDPSLKKLVTFRQMNLIEDRWPMQGTFDAIFCRNVVIYFDKPTKQKLFDRLADRLPIGGILYIGHSENLHGVSDRYELIGRTIYRRVK